MAYRLSATYRGKLLVAVAAFWSTDSLITLGASSLQLACNDSEKRCGLVGCWSELSMHVPTAPTLPIGADLTITLCHGEKCISGRFSLPEPGASMRTHAALRIPAGSLDTSNSAYADISITQTTSSSTIELTYAPSYQDGFADGDHYRLTINDVNNTLLTKEVTVTYTKDYPNGPECDQSPCLTADVTL